MDLLSLEGKPEPWALRVSFVRNMAQRTKLRKEAFEPRVRDFGDVWCSGVLHEVFGALMIGSRLSCTDIMSLVRVPTFHDSPYNCLKEKK